MLLMLRYEMKKRDLNVMLSKDMNFRKWCMEYRAKITMKWWNFSVKYFLGILTETLNGVYILRMQEFLGSCIAILCRKLLVVTYL